MKADDSKRNEDCNMTKIFKTGSARMCPDAPDISAVRDGGDPCPGPEDIPEAARSAWESILELPFHQTLASYIRVAFMSSYESREQVPADPPVPYTLCGESRTTDRLLFKGCPVPPGNVLCLTGRPGCGKTTAIEAMLARYPQVVLHENKVMDFIQVPWIYVVGVPGSSMSAVLGQVAGALDDALRHDAYEYVEAVSRACTLSEKQRLVMSYIEQFAVGMLIIDDADNLDARAFESLIYISDNTGVALLLAGTDGLMHSACGSGSRVIRRMGTCIRADAYCSSRDFFNVLAREMFGKRGICTELTDEAVDVLYDVTDGTVGRLSEICDALYEDYMARGVPDVSAGHIRDIAENI